MLKLITEVLIVERLQIKNISSLEKLIAAAECTATEYNSGSALLNEEFSYQIAYKGEGQIFRKISTVEIDSDIAECITVYCVKGVPVIFRDGEKADEKFRDATSAIIPDVLEPYNKCIPVSTTLFRTLWVSVKVGGNISAGRHTIKIIFKTDGEITGVSEFELDVIGAKLLEADIPYTNWIYPDCIADIHNCGIFSEEHWLMIDKYMQMASQHGVNMMLTPVITPPLDTRIGTERPTVQLVDITYDKGRYIFGFDKLGKWLELCKKNNIEYIEVAHLFSQWGGEKTPKVIVEENGKKISKFGWHTDALSNEYKEFLAQFIPALTNFFEKNMEKENVYFHLTDEPSEEHIEHYGKLYEFVKPFLNGFRQMDALSEYSFYEKGVVETPVVITPHISDYVSHNVENLWAYTCSWPYDEKYSNRFLEFPSRRNRIIGCQLYKYNIKGFLHWGYNFYYSRLSVQLINPYITNDAEGGFPPGDAFCVYPAGDGVIPSVRLKVFYQGLQDMMALKLLEKLAGRDEVMNILEKEKPIEFDVPPESNEYILKMREKINRKIKEIL